MEKLLSAFLLVILGSSIIYLFVTHVVLAIANILKQKEQLK